MVSNVAGFGFIVKIEGLLLATSFCSAREVLSKRGWLSSGSFGPAWLAGAADVPRALRYQLALIEGLFTALVAVMPWLCRAVV